MSEREPKDMTVSELLRRAARDSKRFVFSGASAMDFLRITVGSEETDNYSGDLVNALEVIADKIDAEIEAARGNHLADVVESCIEMHGYPSRRECERFDRWLERCFIQRPLDEKGEPVQFGDRDIDWDYIDECRVPGLLNATAVDIRGKILATTFNKIVAVAKTGERGRVKRTAPEVLGADGLPIKVGDVVYELGRDDALTVCEVNVQYIHAKKESGAAWNNLTAKYLTHTPPDTQERIDADAQKGFDEYWCCIGASCDCCPSKIDGKKPKERFGTDYCSQAIVFDLLRRQRELDARKGGAE